MFRNETGRPARRGGALLTVGLMIAGLAQPSSAGSGAPARPGLPSIKNLSYDPEPKYGTIPARPDPEAVPKPNPGGAWNAYDLNVYETIWFPTRQAGDESGKDAPGGAIAHGVCPGIHGCPNHSLEFIKFWTKSMNSLVKPFGGVARAYPFENVGDAVRTGVLSTPSGKAFNLQATIPGAVHPERMVIVSGHYDQTDSGPASAWDSAEGHATVFRIAKLMTDYWRKTGTQPAVTVKFSAWAGEESGTNGSAAYVRDQILPFPTRKVLGYFNLDPCGGAYPAYYRGNPAYQVKMVMHLSNPNTSIVPGASASIEKFNKQARKVLGDVMNRLDDNLTDVPGSPEIFISDEEAEKKGVASQESMVVPALGGLSLFSSDYRNFEAIGTPIMNLFPDMFGPHRTSAHRGWHADGIATLHTPQDNLLTLNALTGIDQAGLTASQGWYKGLEFCAHMNAWFMLQKNMGGATKIANGPLAFYEVLHNGPAPLKAKKALTFDASGSRGWMGRRLVSDDDLQYSWNFGDGTSATGRVVKHSFPAERAYKVTLTVRGAGGTDTTSMFVNLGS